MGNTEENGPAEIRTLDPQLARLVLYQLSYRPPWGYEFAEPSPSNFYIACGHYPGPFSLGCRGTAPARHANLGYAKFA